MEFKKLPSNSKRLLDELVHSENPVELLHLRLEKASPQESEKLYAILRELTNYGYITAMQWADNMPYRLVLSNSARTYDEMLVEYERGNSQKNESLNRLLRHTCYNGHRQGRRI